MAKITAKDAMRIVEIADKLVMQYDLTEITKEQYYQWVADEFNKSQEL